MSGPQKHSLTLRGHRTSVTLEPEFWAAFQALAQKRGLSVNALAAEMDAALAFARASAIPGADDALADVQDAGAPA